MNILTIPLLAGGNSHLIPAFVIHRRYIKNYKKINNYFLIPKSKHNVFNDQHIKYLNIDYKILNEDLKGKGNLKAAEKILHMESEAFSIIKPKVIIEDCTLSSIFIAEKNNVPRISIYRTGFFRSIPNDLRNKNHMHSLEKGFSKIKKADFSTFFTKEFPDLSIQENINHINLQKNYLNPKTKLIPGIPSIEVLPDDIQNRGSYFYTGPLLVQDNPSDKLKQELSNFLGSVSKEKKVFITTGTVDSTDISPLIDILLKKGYIVISTQKHKALDELSSRFYYNPFLPLNYLCSQVDLVIHQCGSGMYHYPILNEKPTITIGTQCYDREDIAQRLQLLGVSKHTPHKNDDKNYLDVFKSHLLDFENASLCDFDKLKELKSETYETMLSFDMAKVIEFTLS